MAQRRRRTREAAPGPAAAPTAAASATAGSRPEIHLLAGCAAAVCIALGWLSRHALNPDGVSYLDLAALAMRGDWSRFTQGYWSPLLPLLLAVIGRISSVAGPRLVAPAHWINVAAALIALAIIWRWSLRRLPGAFGRAAIPAFLLVSAGVPRIEAVTPDVLLLLAMTALASELIVHRGRRWIATGALLGATFLIKTSCWPWILVTLPVRWWAAPDRTARRNVALSTVVAAAVMAAWVAPLSVRAGHVTLGSSGRLNYSWYIDVNSSRLPDSDLGDHAGYRRATLPGAGEITIATFDQASSWTYQPWGDPVAWAGGVRQETGSPPTPGQLISYWLRQGERVASLWLSPLVLAVLVPVWLLWRRRGMVRELTEGHRDEAAAMALGLAGVLQFVAVHAEPRLIAPFAMLLALGAIEWWTSGAPAPGGIPRPARLILGWAGAATMTVFAALKLAEGVRSNAHLEPVVANLDAARRRLELAGQLPVSIGVIGPAAPVMSAAYWIGARIAIQIPPQSAALLETLPSAEQDRVVASVFGGRVPVLWRTSADGNVKMMLAPP